MSKTAEGSSYLAPAPHSLLAGSLSHSMFEAILAHTRMSGEGLVAALRAHLVEGCGKTEAADRYAVSRSQFFARLKAFQEKAGQLFEFAELFCVESVEARSLTIQQAEQALEAAEFAISLQRSLLKALNSTSVLS